MTFPLWKSDLSTLRYYLRAVLCISLFVQRHIPTFSTFSPLLPSYPLHLPIIFLTCITDLFIKASTNESGLGLTTWWQEQQTEPEGEYTEDAGEEAAEEAFGEDAGAEMEEDEGLVAEEAHNEENGEDDAPEAEE